MPEDFRGVFAIPVTPFDPSGAVDEVALRRCVEFSLAAGAHGLVAPVNASEFTTLSDAERLRVVEVLVETTAGQVPVVAGAQGTCAAHAAGFARHARAVGADAVIAMPPYIHKGSRAEVIEYYRAVAANAQLPVFIQNNNPPVGASLSAEAMVAIMREVDGVVYVKEETDASSQVISALRAADSPMRGVMGGKAGRQLLDEHRRGACGTMPACELTDVHVALWNALEAGDEAGARRIFERMLPLLNFEWVYKVVAYKEVLRRRGVLPHSGVRQPGLQRLDPLDHRELDGLLAGLEDLLTAAPLAQAGPR